MSQRAKVVQRFAQITFRRFLPNARLQSDVMDSVLVHSSYCVCRRKPLKTGVGAEPAPRYLLYRPRACAPDRDPETPGLLQDSNLAPGHDDFLEESSSILRFVIVILYIH